MESLGSSPAGRAHASRAVRAWLIAALAAAVALAIASLPRIPQDPRYHAFADTRAWWGIPNALDVLSSAAFLAAGVAGLLGIGRRAALFQDPRERTPWLALFASVALVGVGSAWYHLHPTNATLVLDRLPMAAGFGALAAAIVAERLGAAAGARVLAPAMLAEVASVLYWYATETRGAGDLRPYAFMQLFPMLMVILLLVLFPARYTRGGGWLAALGLYGLSKLAEVGDVAIYRAGGIVSGHTLKHLVAALGIAVLLRMLVTRKPLSAAAVGGP